MPATTETAAEHSGIDLSLTRFHCPGTLLGCLPLNLVLVQVGCNLKEVTSLGELTDPRFVAASTALGALVAIGLIYKVKAKAKKNE